MSVKERILEIRISEKIEKNQIDTGKIGVSLRGSTKKKNGKQAQ